jgi:nitrous oxide reductase accessory protein NosL
VNEQRAQLAMSVAALFLAACQEKSSAPPPAMTIEKANGGQVHCLGIHECKGKSACHVAGGHACAGQNECKGKGWIDVPRTECSARGGKVLEG